MKWRRKGRKRKEEKRGGEGKKDTVKNERGKVKRGDLLGKRKKTRMGRECEQ